MRLNHKVFFNEYKAAFYPQGGLQQETVTALDGILNRVERDGLEFYGTLEAIAYCLATWRHESGHITKDKRRIEYVPVEERRANPRTQGALYARQARYFSTGHQGRGIVQTTWADNYFKVGEHPGIKGLIVHYNGRDYQVTGAWLRSNPDAMLDEELSYRAAAYGMRDGIYTGKKLSQYFRKGKPPDYHNARMIVNGLDQAELIAGYARALERALRAALLPDNAPAPAPPLAIALDAPESTPERPEAEEEEESYTPPFEAANSAAPEPETPSGKTTYSYPPPPAPPTPDTQVKPTSFNGKLTAVTGFVLANGVAIYGRIISLPMPVLVALIAGIAVVIAAIFITILRLKDRREQRAHEKELAIINASKGRA